MGRMVILCLKPHQGKETELRHLMRDHRAKLEEKGLVTGLKPIHMKTEAGNIIEIFEWKSDEAIEAAHDSSIGKDLWKHFDQVCDFCSLSELNESKDKFANFDRISLMLDDPAEKGGK